jgi:uncharacterized protein YlxW (UPF0749 family)
VTSIVRRHVSSWQLTLGAALLVLGFLIAAQLRSQAPLARYASSELPTLRETAQQLQDAQDALKLQIAQLRAQIQAAEQGGQGNGALVASLNAQLSEARLASGLVALQGHGVVVRLDDSSVPVPPDAVPADYLVSATDLRQVIDQLWLAGAEAVSVNGERIVTTTAMTDIGTSILVNSTYLQAPYDISAIGPSDLWDRFVNAPGFLAFTQARVQAVSLDLSMTSSDQVVVPAFDGTTTLSEALPAPSPTPSPTPTARPSKGSKP